MSVQEDHRNRLVSERPTPVPTWAVTCPTWCVLVPGHVAAEQPDGATAVLHRGAESTVACHSTELAAPVYDSVEVRVCQQWWAEFDAPLGVWVAAPEPTVHVSDLPDFPLSSRDARALAAALTAAAARHVRTPGDGNGV